MATETERRISTGRFARERAAELLGKGSGSEATAWALCALYDLLYGEFTKADTIPDDNERGS